MEAQSKHPFPYCVDLLQHIYMLGYLQAGSEAAAAVREQIDASIQVMLPK